MKKIASIFLCTMLCIGYCAAKDNSDFEAMKESMNQQYAAFEQSTQESMSSIEAEYDAFQKRFEAEYDVFKQEVKEEWGEQEAKVSDRYRWVEYGEDRKSRSTVDFESGEVEIELLLSDEELNNQDLLASKVEGAVEKLVESKGKSVEFDSDCIPQEELSDKPILDDIIDIRASKISREVAKAPISTPEPAASSSTAKLEQDVSQLRQQTAGLQSSPLKEDDNSSAESEPTAITKSVTKVQTSEGEKNLVTIKSSLKVGYLGELAKKYESLVMSNAERFNISPTLIFAVMETESYFNPTATSHVPAYGLMQIVPKFAGRDVYKKLYGKDKIVSKDYLYKADNNIEMGVCFINILSTHYFKGVTDIDSRELCAVAAYNTGPGNVSRALVGHTNVFKSISKINSMSYDELYSYLRRNLPYVETRNYIERVTTKREKYIAK